MLWYRICTYISFQFGIINSQEGSYILLPSVLFVLILIWKAYSFIHLNLDWFLKRENMGRDKGQLLSSIQGIRSHFRDILPGDQGFGVWVWW